MRRCLWENRFCPYPSQRMRKQFLRGANASPSMVKWDRTAFAAGGGHDNPLFLWGTDTSLLMAKYILGAVPVGDIINYCEVQTCRCPW